MRMIVWIFKIAAGVIAKATFAACCSKKTCANSASEIPSDGFDKQRI